jgi:hypothetical protein
VRWNEEQWGLRAERVRYQREDEGNVRLEGWLYLDKRGRVCLPPRNPYVALQLVAPDTEKRSRLYMHWMAVAELFVRDIGKRGVSGLLSLPPGLLDGRPFQWAGFSVGIRYTTVIEFPLRPETFDRCIGKSLRRAEAGGYTVCRSTNWSEVDFCLRQAESRKSFSHQVGASGLRECFGRMGEDGLCAYVAHDRSGEPVCSHVRLCRPGSFALGWSAGTHSMHLQSGVNQLTYLFGLKDLERRGLVGVDLCGSNIASVAAAKSNWGAALVPYITVSSGGWRAASSLLLSGTLLSRLKRVRAVGAFE